MPRTRAQAELLAIKPDDRTDEQTLAFVRRFWTLDFACPPEFFDRSDLLQQRLNDQHGWQV